jgi:hypothetical protein
MFLSVHTLTRVGSAPGSFGLSVDLDLKEVGSASSDVSLVHGSVSVWNLETLERPARYPKVYVPIGHFDTLRSTSTVSSVSVIHGTQGIATWTDRLLTQNECSI